MGLGTGGWTDQTSTSAAQVDAVPGTRGRTAGSTVLPELPQFAAQFLTGGRPVCTNIISDLGDMALDFQLVLLEPRHVQFLSGSTALELTGDVLVVVTDNPEP